MHLYISVKIVIWLCGEFCNFNLDSNNELCPQGYLQNKRETLFPFCEIDKTFLMLNECGFLKLFAVFNHNRKPSQTKSMTHCVVVLEMRSKD